MSELNWAKYNRPVPRYTSYPTVPDWNSENFDFSEALHRLTRATDENGGFALYIHLPFCESLCTYCGCNKRITKNHLVERPYINALLREFDLYSKFIAEGAKITGIHLGGGTPTFFSPENLQYLLENILKHPHVEAGEMFSFEAHPANTSREHLETLYNLGFRRLSLGVQDFDPKVQTAIHRFQTVDDVQTVITQAREIGYTSINFDLIYGLPFQNELSFSKTLEESIALQPDRLAYYSYAHVPWTSPGQRAYDENDLPDAATKLALHHMGREAFLAAGYADIGMDHFVFPQDGMFRDKEQGYLHRNFMGYTHAREKVLLGLGTSSISDVGNAFWQNEKKNEIYQALLKTDELPVIKGHLLTDREQKHREIIQSISCYRLAKWDSEVAEFLEDSGRIDVLKDMEMDGLLDLDGNHLQLTSLGTTFLRNVCSVFDVNYPIMGAQTIQRSSQAI
ncbi:MAG: oxygen-independent coproporphyrinogen III oxidase [Flavobacteriales bacterium]|nr:MAG: oxygen-independent coproporphyrinogen III oxidase [Flavobacteriales bacterium]